MKFFRSFQALLLLISNVSIFRPAKEFKNKRVAVIGAADSAFYEKKGNYIDGFDIVVRINKAPHHWSKEKAEYIGSKFTILYHSFFENNFSGGGPLDWELFNSLGLRKIINPNCSFRGIVAQLNFYKRQKENRKTYILKPGNYFELKKGLGPKIPTVGYSALCSVLQSECKEIYITGFTFFKTPYAKNYRKELSDPETNLRHLKKQGIHDPELEFENFKKALKNSRCKNILFDKGLQQILKSGST